MGERYPIAKLIADIPKRLAHIAEQKKLGRWHAIGMGGDMALANIDLAVREQPTKMIVSSAIAEAELKHRAIQIANEMSRVVQASTLRFKTADKTV